MGKGKKKENMDLYVDLLEIGDFSRYFGWDMDLADYS
jgi:hypothetical protein